MFTKIYIKTKEGKEIIDVVRGNKLAVFGQFENFDLEETEFFFSENNIVKRTEILVLQILDD